MTKRDYAILGLHIVIVSGITAGYICMNKKIEQKKSKLYFNNLD